MKRPWSDEAQKKIEAVDRELVERGVITYPPGVMNILYPDLVQDTGD